MGMEAKVRMRRGATEGSGALHLDSTTLEFRSKQIRWSAKLGPDIQATANAAGWLTVTCAGETFEFELGKQAAKWAEKILNPPSRLQKLGVKPGMKCRKSGTFDASFLAELKTVDVAVTRSLERCDLAFLLLPHRESLGRIADVAAKLPAGINLWVVWPKGSEAIGQADVMKAAASLGLGPSKTPAFDERHSSLRFAKKH